MDKALSQEAGEIVYLILDSKLKKSNYGLVRREIIM